MSYSDSVARLQASRAVPDAFRFSGTAALTVARRILANEKSVDGLSVVLGRKENGEAEAWIVVMLDGNASPDARAECDDPTNFSHSCPPFTDC